MTAASAGRARRGPALAPIALRLALRDLRGGLSGLWIVLLCVALGVAAIAGVGSVAGSLAQGLSTEGRRILGGDVAISLVSQPLSVGQTHYLALRGALSTIVTTRAMARRADGESALVDVKAVDDTYPTVGTLQLAPEMTAATALDRQDGLFGIAADPALIARLDLKLGDRVTIGTASFVLRAAVDSEPDKLGGGMSLAPRVLMRIDALKEAGLVDEGALARWTTRIDLGGTGPAGADDDAVERFVAEARAAFPQAGWDIRTRRAVSPEFDRNLTRFSEFLTLVGLTALVVGGVGIANAVSAAMQRKRASLAVLKAVGAPGRVVFLLGLAQVGLVALIGTFCGLLVGAALPYGVGLFGLALPIPLVPSLHPGALALGLLYGLLTTAVFSLTPLGRAHDVPVSALFRDQVDPDAARLRPVYRLALALATLLLVGAAVLFSPDHLLALAYAGSVVAIFALLRLVAWLYARLARALPHPRRVDLRLALANIHRPGALTPAVILSLGLGLTLLVALTLIDANIQAQVGTIRPGLTPSFFFIDIPSGKADTFADFLAEQAPGASVERVPMLRGRITALAGVPVEAAHPKQSAAWVLEGDRGITYAQTVPPGSRVVDGAWWPAGYTGEPLVSFDADLAEGLGLKLGDTITVAVLGRPVTARIANLRKIDWQSLGINFVMIFSPNTFAGAPHMVLATAALPQADAATEGRLARAVAARFPTVTAVRVRDVLDAVNGLVAKLAIATRAASGVTLLAAILVLSGALAAGRRARVYDAVVLKVLGATRGRLLTAFVLEYALLGLGAALFGIAAGTLAAAVVVERVMTFDFHFALAPPLEACAAALVVTIGLGLAGTWRILGQGAAAYLREG